MVTSLMAEPASLAAARHAVARTAGAGGKREGRGGGERCFHFHFIVLGGGQMLRYSARSGETAEAIA